MGDGVHVVWFKRDLRTRDHQPLQRALQLAAHQGGRVLLLQVFEPGLLAHPTTSSRHLAFQWDCGNDVDFTLRQEGWGLTLHRVCAPILSVLEHLSQTLGVAALHSHEETGILWTFERDNQAKWCKPACLGKASWGFNVGERLVRDGWRPGMSTWPNLGPIPI